MNWTTGEMLPAWSTPDIREEGSSSRHEVRAVLVHEGDTQWSVRIGQGHGVATTPEAAFVEAVRLAAEHVEEAHKEAARYRDNREVHIRGYGASLCGQTSKYVDHISFLAPSKRFGLVTCAGCLALQITWAEKNQRDQLRELARTLRRVSQLELA
jgi:hypothetical protein